MPGYICRSPPPVCQYTGGVPIPPPPLRGAEERIGCSARLPGQYWQYIKSIVLIITFFACPFLPVLLCPFLFSLTCPGCPVLAVLFWVFCSSYPVLAELSLLSGHGHFILVSPVLADLSWQPCPGDPVLVVLSWRSFYSLFCPGSPVLAAVLSWQFYLLVVLFWQTYFGFLF
jgi:hypothetical protein